VIARIDSGCPEIVISIVQGLTARLDEEKGVILRISKTKLAIRYSDWRGAELFENHL
jgi:hypothetical protein